MVKYNNNSKIFLKKNFLMQKCSFYVSYILKDIFFSRQNGTVSFEKLKIILCTVALRHISLSANIIYVEIH